MTFICLLLRAARRSGAVCGHSNSQPSRPIRRDRRISALLLGLLLSAFAPTPALGESPRHPRNAELDAFADEALRNLLQRRARNEQNRFDRCLVELGSSAFAEAVNTLVVNSRVHRATAQDFAADALLAVCTKHHVRAIRDLRPYYFKTVANLHRRSHRNDSIAERALRFFTDSCSLQESEASDPFEVEALKTAFHELSSDHKEVLLAYAALGSHTEVARQLNIEHAAARQRHSRAMARLSELVLQRCN